MLFAYKTAFCTQLKPVFYKNDSRVWKYFVILQPNYKTTEV